MEVLTSSSGTPSLSALAFIDVEEDLRNARAEQAVGARRFRALFARSLGEALDLLRQIGRVDCRRAILEHHREAGAGAEARDRGRAEGECGRTSEAALAKAAFSRPHHLVRVILSGRAARPNPSAG